MKRIILIILCSDWNYNYDLRGPTFFIYCTFVPINDYSKSKLKLKIKSYHDFNL